MEEIVKYEMAAIPTKYKGVVFRSRLESRWAAFFDLNNWSWDYEPIDLTGWAPDFMIRTPYAPVFVEIKPVPLLSYDDCLALHPAYEKATRHRRNVQVWLLGQGPCDRFYIGNLLDPPDGAIYFRGRLYTHLHFHSDAPALWHEAGNRVRYWGANA